MFSSFTFDAQETNEKSTEKLYEKRKLARMTQKKSDKTFNLIFFRFFNRLEHNQHVNKKVRKKTRKCKFAVKNRFTKIFILNKFVMVMLIIYGIAGKSQLSLNC